ncbi:hypothetical protein IBT50_27010, partial [Bacillus sp. S70]|uniref:flagellar motor protein MotB n=1 Tax=Bacillus sp. S70 TaxID=1226988 RepID=UPI001909E0C9
HALTEPNNFVEHFIDSSGVVSWRFFSAKADFPFVEWDFTRQGEAANAEEAATRQHTPKIAFADFATAMMAFFLVLWL